MKVTLYNEEVDLATYCGDDLRHFMTDLLEDIEFAVANNRDKDYDHALEVFNETLEYILYERRA